MSVLADSELVNGKVLFDEKRGKPFMSVREKGKRVYITCRMMGGATKDNGYIVGTYFVGKITEKDGVTSVRGLTLTSPLFHLLLFALAVFYVYRCISLGGFNPIPLILFLFSIFMFKDEYKKQGIIKRYVARAIRKAEEKFK